MTKAVPLTLDAVRRRVLRSANSLIYTCMAMLAFSAITLVGMLVFAIFSDGSLRDWAIAVTLAGTSMVALSAARMIKDAAKDIVTVVESFDE